MSTKIEDRCILLLQEITGGNISFAKTMTWAQLEDVTKISAQRWSKAFARRQRPTPDMIEALAKLFPQYAFWIATGITDAINGHIAPESVLCFPEQGHLKINHMSQVYFERSLELSNNLFKLGRIDLSNDEARLNSIKRVCRYEYLDKSKLIGTQECDQIDDYYWEYGDALLSKVIPELIKTNEYQELVKYWESRDNQMKNKPSEGLFYDDISAASASKS